MSNVLDALSIIDDMHADGADDIVLFYRTFDHIALAPALRCSVAIGDVVGPHIIQARRQRDLEIIEDCLITMLFHFVAGFMFDGVEPNTELNDIVSQIVQLCTKEALSLDAAIGRCF